ncbi:MAG: MGMT family protein [Firmicutes bacterium]|jgi:methylated-DNA-protein-cysteine methyltransferase-like protein|nr:MGMT family protein [Bacillota bacterium]MDH7496406.1 MGMT family protein [Bacillota bacterium]
MIFEFEEGEGRNTFFRRVYDVVAQIPPGKVATYGQIAAWLESPRGARTVGWALWEAPPHLGLPCHRVVTKCGAMAPPHVFGGEGRQRAMLEAEGVSFKDNGCVDMTKHMVEGPAFSSLPSPAPRRRMGKPRR